MTSQQRQPDLLFQPALDLDTIFVQIAPGRLFVAHGPFERSAVRDPGHPAFYVNDFFLSSPTPWQRPARWEEIDPATVSLPGGAAPLQVSWESVSRDLFLEIFEDASSSIREGLFAKIVPILFEAGVSGSPPAGLSAHLFSQVARLPPTVHAYGAFGAAKGVIGASPEVLFQKDRNVLRTMALAGTCSLEEADELLSDPKERSEHRIVVDDIVTQLAGAGEIEVGPTVVRRYPNLAHLATAIELAGSEDLSFEEAVRRLHPTAALGSWPRSLRAQEWLRRADRNQNRGIFGAPFGIAMPDGTALCLVAIRNVEWNGARVRIGAGNGILQGSVPEHELEEQQRKRDQVKILFGLESGKR